VLPPGPGIHEWTKDAMALTETQEKVQVCETNLVGRIMGVARADNRRKDELRVKESVKNKIGYE